MSYRDCPSGSPITIRHRVIQFMSGVRENLVGRAGFGSCARHTGDAGLRAGRRRVVFAPRDDQRLVINDPGYRIDGVAHVTAHFGYQDQPDVPRLLRDVFTAAGGTHDNWPEYDRIMAEERRTAVFVKIERQYGVVRS